jgi:hypothetical protein
MNFAMLLLKKMAEIKVKAIFACVVFFASTASFAQAPPNDNSCQAITLTPSENCTYTQASTANATSSTGMPNPGCGFVNGSTPDVWFIATVPAGGALTFNTEAGTLTDGALAVYRGNTCNALVLLRCSESSSSGNMPAVTVTNLVPGATVYVRFWPQNATDGSFGICATIPPPPPANDEPCTAIELTPSATCNYQTFTNLSATNTISVPSPVCAGFAGGDVWFKVVVPTGTTSLIFDTQQGSILDGGMIAYSGSSCNSTLTQLTCDDNSSGNPAMPKITLTGLIPNDTIWVRFWENENDNNGTFGICVTLPLPPPANDEPCGAIPLSIGNECNFGVTYTIESATGTSSVADPGCANYTGGDVWFKFVVPPGGGVILNSDEGTINDGGMAAYSGSCSNLTLISCDDNSSINGNMPSLTLTGLVPNDTIWVRFWENNGDNSGTFSICATLPPPPPVNDDPCNALLLSLSPTCTYETFSNQNATGTDNVGYPSCSFTYYGGDVWFKTVIPAEGALVINTEAIGLTDAAMVAYTGTCDNLIEVACNEDASASVLMPRLLITTLNPGDTVWVRLWDYGGDDFGPFGICVTLPPPPPVNDNPCSAIQLSVSGTSVCNFEQFTNQDALPTNGVPFPGCGSYAGGDVWFKVVVPSGGAIQFDTKGAAII